MKFSVIIPAYNASATLDRLLESLDQQSFADYEVIVVDDGSSDNTPEVAARYGIRYERLETNQGPATARNRGAALAVGEWFVFTDADTVFARDTLQAVDKVLDSSGAAALFGTYSGKPANEGFFPRYKALWEYYAIDMVFVKGGERELCPSTTWLPRPGVVSRAAFEAVGGFDTRFRRADLEDVEFGYRLHEGRYPIYFVPSIRIEHAYPATLSRGLVTVWRRSAMWIRMAVRRRKLDVAGDASPGKAASHLLGFSVFWLAVMSLWWPFLTAPAIAGLACHTFLHRRFLALALREEGAGFMAMSFVTYWIYTLVGCFAAGYGLATAFPRTR